MRPSLLWLVLFAAACVDNAGDDPKDSGDAGDDVPDYADGCITVDGEGGYAYINDAIAVASEGSTLALCAGTYEEAVLVDKSVTILGVAGAIVSAPANEVAFTVTADGVTIQDVAVESTRTGLQIDGASGTTLSGLAVGATGSWAIAANGALDTRIESSTFTQPTAGAIQIVGGTATVDLCTFDAPNSFGVHVSDDAAVTVSNSTFQGTVALGDDDGNAIYVSGGTLVTEANTIEAADVAGIWAEDAVLTLSGDTIVDTWYGILGMPAEIDATGLTIENAPVQGIFAYTDVGSLSLSDSTIALEAGTGCELTYEEWGTDGFVCGGVLFQAMDIAFSGVSVSGYENYGIVAWGADTDTPLAMSGVTVSDTGRRGLHLSGVAGTVSDSTFTALREPEMPKACTDDVYIYLDRSTAVLVADGDVAFTNSVFQGNDGWGLSNVQATVTVDGSTFDGNACAGLLNYQGSATLTGATITNGGADYGSVYDYQGVTTVSGSTFATNHANYEYEYSDGVSTWRNVQTGYALDIQGYESANLVVTGNTFTDGDRSIYLYGGTGEVVGNTWNDYEGNLVSLVDAGGTTPVYVGDNAADDVGGSVVSASYADVEVEGLTIGTTRGYTYSYESYKDDVLQYSYSGESWTQALYAYGWYYDDGVGNVYDNPASLSLEDVTVASTISDLIYASDASLDIQNVTATNVGSGTYGGSGIVAYWSDYAADIEVEGLVLDTVGGSGVEIFDESDQEGTASFTGVQVGAAGAYGLFQQGLSSISVADSAFSATTDAGVSSQAVYEEYGTGVLNAATAVTLTNVAVTGAGASGIEVLGGSLTATGLTVSQAEGAGIEVTGATTATVATSTVADSRYGVVVTAATLFTGDWGGTLQLDGETVTTLTDLTVSGSYADGVSVDGGTATIAGLVAYGNGGDGLSLADVAATVTGGSVTANHTYGMTCDADVDLTCTTTDVSGNQLGEMDGCEASCSP